MTIEIKPTAPNGDAFEQHTLYVNGFPAAHVQATPAGVFLNWSVYGPQQWPEAKLVLEGLLELSVLADQLTTRPRHAKASRKARVEDDRTEETRTRRDEVLGVRYVQAVTGKEDFLTEEAAGRRYKVVRRHGGQADKGKGRPGDRGTRR